MERTKKYRLWFQAASELIKEERKYELGQFSKGICIEKL